MRTPRAWFRCEVAGETAEFFIFDLIGDWIDDLWGMGGNGVTTAKSFLDVLAALPESVKTLRVHVNSPGGDVFSAVAIANMLRVQSTEKGRTVEMSIEGLAASAASIVICAGDVIRMADNALVMIHNPWSFAIGSADEMRKSADTLDTIRDQIIATYRWVSSLSAEALRALMDAETWMDATAALERGFATEIVTGLKAAAALRPDALAKLAVPEQYRARVAALVRAEALPSSATPTVVDPPPAEEEKKSDAPPPDPQPEEPAAIARACLAAGFPALAEGLITAQATPADVATRLGRAREVAVLCKAAKLDDLATGFVTADIPLATVRAQLQAVKAKLDATEIDTTLQPDRHVGAAATPDLNPRAIYGARNAVTKGV